MKKSMGTREVVSRISALRKAAGIGLKDAALISLLSDRVRGRFMQGVTPQGVPWPGLMLSTIKRKMRNKEYTRPRQLLYATGRLYESIGPVTSSAGVFASATGLGIRIGVRDTRRINGRPSPAEYGRWHNYGKGGQEERRFIGLSSLDLAAVTGMIRRRLAKAAAGGAA